MDQGGGDKSGTNDILDTAKQGKVDYITVTGREYMVIEKIVFTLYSIL